MSTTKGFYAFHAEQDAILAARGLLPSDEEIVKFLNRGNEVESWSKSVDSIEDIAKTRELFT